MNILNIETTHVIQLTKSTMTETIMPPTTFAESPIGIETTKMERVLKISTYQNANYLAKSSLSGYKGLNIIIEVDDRLHNLMRRDMM